MDYVTLPSLASSVGLWNSPARSVCRYTGVDWLTDAVEAFEHCSGKTAVARWLCCLELESERGWDGLISGEGVICNWNWVGRESQFIQNVWKVT